MPPTGPRKRKWRPKTEQRTLTNHWDGPTIAVGGTDIKLLLRFVLFLLALKQIGLMIYLAVNQRYDFTMYTYWSYTMLGAFYVLAWAALWMERQLLTAVAMIAYPPVLGSVALVCVAIVVIINENPDVFMSGTTGPKALAVSLIHTGDWVLHSLPLIEILLLESCGWLFYMRLILGNQLSAIKDSNRRVMYILYVFLSPLVPFAIYTGLFDIREHYPTNIPTYILWLGLVLICLLWQGGHYAAYTVSADAQIRLWILSQGGENIALPSPPSSPSNGDDSTLPASFNSEAEVENYISSSIQLSI